MLIANYDGIAPDHHIIKQLKAASAGKKFVVRLPKMASAKIKLLLERNKETERFSINNVISSLIYLYYIHSVVPHIQNDYSTYKQILKYAKELEND